MNVHHMTIIINRYSMECLLSFIEFNQFQEYVLRNQHNILKLDDAHDHTTSSPMDADDSFLVQIQSEFQSDNG